MTPTIEVRLTSFELGQLRESPAYGLVRRCIAAGMPLRIKPTFTASRWDPIEFELTEPGVLERFDQIDGGVLFRWRPSQAQGESTGNPRPF
jgi:hypothetical protein